MLDFDTPAQVSWSFLFKSTLQMHQGLVLVENNYLFKDVNDTFEVRS